MYSVLVFYCCRNKLPQIRDLNNTFIPCSVGQKSWYNMTSLVLCSGYHKAEIGILAGLVSCLQALGGNLFFRLIQIVGRIQFFAVAGLWFLSPCWQLATVHILCHMASSIFEANYRESLVSNPSHASNIFDFYFP